MTAATKVPGTRKPRAKKETLPPEDQAPENSIFVVPASLLQEAVNILAQLPYQNVGTILNQLLQLQPMQIQTITPTLEGGEENGTG